MLGSLGTPGKHSQLKTCECGSDETKSNTAVNGRRRGCCGIQVDTVEGCAIFRLREQTKSMLCVASFP